MLEKATIYVRQGMVYIPTEAKLVGDGAGIILSIEPIYIGSPTREFLIQTLEPMVAGGHPHIPTPKIIGYEPSEDPVLKGARVRSYRKFTQGAAMYTISWRKNEVMLYASLPDSKRKGGWFNIETGPEWSFPSSVRLQSLVDAILEDARARPELLVP